MQVFNIEESGFSTRTASHSRAKAFFDSHGRSNFVELKWSANAQHVTIMHVVSADGRAWSLLAVRPDNQAENRKKQTIQSKHHPRFCHQHLIECIERTPGYKRVYSPKLPKRGRFRRIVLIFDSYGDHVSYRVVKLFIHNDIVVVGVPEHYSHRTQPRDYAVYSPYKTAFWNQLNNRSLSVKENQHDDLYTVCELLADAYNQVVTF